MMCVHAHFKQMYEPSLCKCELETVKHKSLHAAPLCGYTKTKLNIVLYSTCANSSYVAVLYR